MKYLIPLLICLFFIVALLNLLSSGANATTKTVTEPMSFEGCKAAIGLYAPFAESAETITSTSTRDELTVKLTFDDGTITITCADHQMIAVIK